MIATTVESTIHTLEVTRDEQIAAPVEIVFETILEQLGPELEVWNEMPMPMKLEAWPGGRWYRDLGNDAGHFWGHVQVIKPPALLELCGPLFMSYPAISHVQYRLTANDGGTLLQFKHRAIGLLSSEHREGVTEGWGYINNRLRQAAERRGAQA